MRDTNLGEEPEEVTELLDNYNVVELYKTELDRVNVQSLGMSIHSLEHGRGTYDFDILDFDDGRAGVYDPEIDFSTVVMFQTGWGYYCCQSPQDLKGVEEWFEEELNEYYDSEILPLQIDS